ncbi:MAG: endonuclease/exonuclease/phosphatase family protein [Clostridiales bacterium]|nr:endonuclease/exonuclease/phosphatase family protein [Clostridiales bacterium]
MKKIIKLLSAFLCAMFICGTFSGCTAAQYQTFAAAGASYIRVATFNCAAPWGNLLDGTASSKRVKLFAAYMNSLLPDSIGTQEMNQSWLDKLADLMPLYDSYGVIRGGDDSENKSEMNAILWLKDKYTLVDKGTFWLSETPLVESIYTGAGCYRICTWVLLENSETGFRYIHMNTHLDNASEEAANYGALVIAQQIGELMLQYPEVAIVLTGDFNETDDGQAYSTMSALLTDARVSAGAEKQTTYHAWGEADSGEPIDYIFMSAGQEAGGYYRLDDISNGYISDHYGLMADILVN